MLTTALDENGNPIPEESEPVPVLEKEVVGERAEEDGKK
jgi:hypothetical protein